MSLRVVFMGTPDFAVPSLRALLQAGYHVVGVFTQPDRPKGRGKKLAQSPVKMEALAHNLPVFQPLKIRNEGVAMLQSLCPDVCVTAAFGQILSQEVLDIPPMGTVNVHASLLPKHRGSAPVQWSILQGDTETGVTTMLTDKGIDTGDMLLSCTTPITPEDTAQTVLDRLSVQGAELLITTLQRLEKGDCPRQPQEHAQSTYDPMLTKEMGGLLLQEGTQACLRRIRAMNGGYLPTASGILKVWVAKEAEGQGKVGEILQANPKGKLVVATADGAMELVEIQAPNAKRMKATAYLLGHPLTAGQQISEGM